jgi:outer membrane receptor protein involved in Fe transport
MARKPRTTKDRTSLVISLIFHVFLIGGVAYWAYKTGQLEKVRQVLLQYTSQRKEQKKEEPKALQPRQPAPKLPPIDTGVAPKIGDGTRRAVVSDAPDAPGDTFFQDTRKQVSGPSTSGGGQSAGAVVPKMSAPPTSPPLPLFRAQGSTTIKQLFAERARQAAATESFGSEQISKTGVSDAGAIINKVSGATVVDGKFAVIRGLSDRYVSTTLNSAEVPSADPYRRSVSLDMFPAQIISKVVVAKTFTPDKPGTYTGGGIDIVTKSFPEKAFFSISGGVAYNTQSTFNENFLDYPGGALDWAGMDDGSRALPGSLSNPGLNIPIPPPANARPTSSRYEESVRNAELINRLTREMGAVPFGPSRGDAPPLNHNFAAATGDTATFFTRPFGYFAGLNYRRDFSFYDNGIARRYGTGDTPGALNLRKDFSDVRATEVVNWAGMVNLAYQIFDDQEIGFNFLFNQNSEDLRRVQVGTVEFEEEFPYTLNRLQFTERNLKTYQLRGGHNLSLLGNARLDWLLALSETSQDEPDARFFNFRSDFDLSKSTIEPVDPTRYFRDLDEQNHNGKFDFTIPFRQWSVLPAEFKFGALGSYSKRNFFDREIFYDGNEGFFGDATQYLTPDNLGYIATTNAAGRIDYDWPRSIGTRRSFYNGTSAIEAGYAMLDIPIFEKLRVVGGARYEITDMVIDSVSALPNSNTGLTENHTELSEALLLPAAGLIYAVRTNMNLRLAYSQTIARPSFRELAAYRSYDPALDQILDGNPLLKNSSINNYDFRWEWFPRPGELLGISLFYKNLREAIEQRFVDRSQEIISFENRPEAKVYGIEFEARKNLDFIDPLLSEFSLGANLSLIESETPLNATELNNKLEALGQVEDTRSLYDQSPYIFNFDLSYDNVRTGTSASIIYNVAGPRIAIANPIGADIYEQPSGSLDFIISQRISRFLNLKFTAKNLLDPEIKRTYGEDSDLLYSSYTRGQTFGISLSADF